MEYRILKIVDVPSLPKPVKQAKKQPLPDSLYTLVEKTSEIERGAKEELIHEVKRLIAEAGFKVCKITTTKGKFHKTNLNFYFTSTKPVGQENRKFVKGGKIVLGGNTQLIKSDIPNMFPRIVHFCNNYYCSLYVQATPPITNLHRVPSNPSLSNSTVINTTLDKVEKAFGVPSDIDLKTGRYMWYLQNKREEPVSIIDEGNNTFRIYTDSKQILTSVRVLITQ